MLLLIVASPVPPAPRPEEALKITRPPPLPSCVTQFEIVTLVSVSVAVPLEPVSYSMQPPSPSCPPTLPRLCPNLIVKF